MTTPSALPGQPGTTVFTLIFTERETNGDAGPALNGPFVFTSKVQAYGRLWEYVENRIPAAFADEFADKAEEFGVAVAADADDDLVSALSDVAPDKRVEVIDWFFEVSDDSTFEAFYQIEEHTPTLESSQDNVDPTNDYSVFGFYEENGQSFLDHVQAKDEFGAMRVSAENRPTATILCAASGLMREGHGLEFAGEGVVDAETILEQSDVFK